MKFEPIVFEGEEIKFIAPSWGDLSNLTFELSKKILAKGGEYDRIVTLAKGGWPQTCSLVDYLGVEYVASMGVKFYAGIGKMLTKPDIYQDIPPVVRGEKILLFDDVADSGRSFQFAKKHLEDFAVESVTTVALFAKSVSKYTPDFVACETDEWIVFPFEARETIEQLGPKWMKAGVGRDEVVDRLKKLGFGEEVIKYYLKR